MTDSLGETALASSPRRGRFGSRVTWLGGIVLAIMMVACLGSLPFTFARGEDHGPRRYEAQNPDAALLPPFWAPHAEDEQAKVDAIEAETGSAPSPLFGTDMLGRDVFVRCLTGGGISLLIGMAAAAISVLIGTMYGAISGYLGGRTDAVMMRIVDILFSLPYILIVVLLAVAMDGIVDRAEAAHIAAQAAAAESGADTITTIPFLLRHRDAVTVATLLVAIAGVSWLALARVVRGQVLSLKAQPFMEASRALGVPMRRQFTHHLLPNLLGPIVVYATLTVPAAILSESFLSFLGIGVRPPLPSWGNLAAEGLGQLNPVRSRWWLLVWPCLCIAITLLALNFLGEGLREAFDPKGRVRRARKRRANTE